MEQKKAQLKLLTENNRRLSMSSERSLSESGDHLKVQDKTFFKLDKFERTADSAEWTPSRTNLKQANGSFLIDALNWALFQLQMIGRVCVFNRPVCWQFR